MAKKIGVSERTIVNREKGKTKPTGKRLEKLRMIMEPAPTHDLH